MTDTKLRWQSARDAWAWADQIEEVRALLLRVDDRYVLHTKSASLLMAIAANQLRARAEREVTPELKTVWGYWITVGVLAWLSDPVAHWINRKPVTLFGLALTGSAMALLVWGMRAVGKRWSAKLRRRDLRTGPTTLATSDLAAERPVPEPADTYAFLSFVAWRVGTLGQAVRLLLLPSRLTAAREREPFRVDVSLAVVYLTDAMDSLKSISDWVESGTEKGGELR
jgi:hypothetical protein